VLEALLAREPLGGVHAEQPRHEVQLHLAHLALIPGEVFFREGEGERCFSGRWRGRGG
jgi:hypothetical protein